MTDPHPVTLNPEQRRAVEHAVMDAQPLLIIAGAGTGKTNTLAHRVAHLIVQGVDWSGTFHAIGARLLREYSERIGLDRDFTIHGGRIPPIS